MASFAVRKAKLMQQLEQPAELYHDASPKGSVDENIRDLVAELNQMNDFVTTSSCGGRIVVYAEGSAKGGAGGKGGGHWLFTSHRPMSSTEFDDPAKLLQLFSVPVLSGESSGQYANHCETVNCFVHFKFEPLILHILARSNESAQKLLTAAMDAGYRESGISGVAPNSSNKPITPMVAIRTAGLGFDCLIARRAEPISDDGSMGALQPLVTIDYLRTILQLANQRFEMNEKRKERFRAALNTRFPVSKTPLHTSDNRG